MTKTYPSRHGAIAAGHSLTVTAGAQMLKQGGNAVDAAVAAAFATFIAEYTLSATGGGGFALVYNVQNDTGDLYDFFSTAPGLGTRQPSPADIDFHQITVDYGVSQQHFYVGRGSVAVPGNVAGLCTLAQEQGRLPLSVILEPAIHLARAGCRVTEMQYSISKLLEPIFLYTPSSRAVFARNGDELLNTGDLLQMIDLANSLEALSREGPSLFYQGDIAQAIVADQATHNGLITMTDLARYRVEHRKPLTSSFHGQTALTNPPPSRGGLLISFALRLLDDFDLEPEHHGDAAYLELLAEVMRVTNLARRELEHQNLTPEQQIDYLLSGATVARWGQKLHELLSLPVDQRPVDAVTPAGASTTQISVLDDNGLAVSMTLTAGEGPGYVVPGTGLVLNNMLGEADLNPLGFHLTPPGRRIPSMMSPTVVLRDGWPALVLGSGGANRIRSAILQVLLNTVAFHLPLAAAVESGRVHWEEGVLQVEAGNDPIAVADLEAAGYTVNRWPKRHLFFGGAHSVARRPNGKLEGHGDSRRAGYAQVV